MVDYYYTCMHLMTVIDQAMPFDGKLALYF